MPVLRFSADRLLQSLPGVSREKLEDALFRLKCESELLEDGSLEIEVNPDRPDMYSLEGVLRAVKGILGLETGWKPPTVEDAPLRVRSYPPPTRPYIAAAVIYNVNITDEEDLRQLIQFQEKLHDTIGRRRRKVAIGFHDLDKLPSAEITYTELNIEITVFTPLGSKEERTAREVLETTEQGEKYGHLALRDGRHPFLLSGDTVIAMPPVINSEITRVDVGTRSLFIDVTGTDLRTVLKTLDIISSNLAEREGARLGKVRILTSEGALATPVLETRSLVLPVERVSGALGFHVTSLEAATLLERMRYQARPLGDAAVEVVVPPFRADIIGEIDIVEDIAIAIGYDVLRSPYSRPHTRGSPSTLARLSRVAREILVGLGYTEMLQLVLTSPRIVSLLGLEAVEVENPVQLEYSVLRPLLAVSILSVLGENQHEKKPVRVFEIGEVVTPNKAPGLPREAVHLAMGYMDSEVSVENVQAPLYALLELLGVEFRVVQECPYRFLIPGRCARLELDREHLGYFGEVHPEVLEALSIEYPIALAEIDMEVLARWRSRMRSPGSA